MGNGNKGGYLEPDTNLGILCAVAPEPRYNVPGRRMTMEGSSNIQCLVGGRNDNKAQSYMETTLPSHAHLFDNNGLKMC